MKIRARTYRFGRAHYETLERVMRVESAEGTIHGKTGVNMSAKLGRLVYGRLDGR